MGMASKYIFPVSQKKKKLPLLYKSLNSKKSTRAYRVP